MKPDFDRMSIAELRAYLLSHRDDNEAFYKLADRLESSFEDTELYPCPDTPDNIAITEAAIRKQINKLEDQRKE